MLRTVSRVGGVRRVLRRTFSSSLPAFESTAATSTESAKWTRPLEPGVLPAYDEALAYIERDSADKKAELARMRQAKDSEWSAAELEKLEVESEINLPEVRWNFAKGNVDLSKPVYRHLLNQRWRRKGRLDRLMERVHLMNAVPDVVPAIRPSVDLRIDFSSSGDIDTIPAPSTSSVSVPAKKLAKDVADPAPEHFLLPAQTVWPPKVTAQVFHVEERLYTLMLVDPDVPDAANETYQNYLHWLVPNIPISALSKELSLPTAASPSSPMIPYTPPHPQRGTPAHRYVLLLLPQPSSSPLTFDPSKVNRLGFDVRGFISQHKLQEYVEKQDLKKRTVKSGEVESQVKIVDAREGGGIAMWREQWDESVSAIYEKILKTSEPHFTKPKKQSPYFGEDGLKYRKYPYIMTTLPGAEVEALKVGNLEAAVEGGATSAQSTASV